MKGKFRVQIKHKKINYDFELKRSITIISGDSGTGKTTLISYIQTYKDKGKLSGIKVICEKECVVLTSRIWEEFRPVYHNCIIFIDEDCDFVTTKEFAQYVSNSDCYFVIIQRENLEMLAYSMNEIYDFVLKGKTNIFKPKYAKYIEDKTFCRRPDIIITEDSNAGYQFYSCLPDVEVISAKGKSNIVKQYLDNIGKQMVLVVDSAAFGSCIEEVVKYSSNDCKVQMYAPESFEYFILVSGIFKVSNIYDNIYEPYKYINYPEYLSWERYFTKLLITLTKDYKGAEYNKNHLKKFYKLKVNQILQGNSLDFLCFSSKKSKQLNKMNIVKK